MPVLQAPDPIEVRYEAVDHFHEEFEFDDLDTARAWAQKWVGTTPEISDTFQYAISADGVGKITCFGASIRDLFPDAA